MIKKALVTVAGASLLGVLFFGRDAASYMTTSVGWMKDSVKSNVPVEFEIEHAALAADPVIEIVERERSARRGIEVGAPENRDVVSRRRVKDDAAAEAVERDHVLFAGRRVVQTGRDRIVGDAKPDRKDACDRVARRGEERDRLVGARGRGGCEREQERRENGRSENGRSLRMDEHGTILRSL